MREMGALLEVIFRMLVDKFIQLTTMYTQLFGTVFKQTIIEKVMLEEKCRRG